MSHGLAAADGGADNEGAGEIALALPPDRSPGVGGQTGLRQGDSGLAIERVDRLDRAVTDNRAERRVDVGQHPLRLAERIGEEDARAPGGDVLAPPGVD